jgi:hypothetical protein
MESLPAVTKTTVSDFCLIQALFKLRCMRLGKARELCRDIFGTDDGAMFC